MVNAGCMYCKHDLARKPMARSAAKIAVSPSFAYGEIAKESVEPSVPEPGFPSQTAPTTDASNPETENGEPSRTESRAAAEGFFACPKTDKQDRTAWACSGWVRYRGMLLSILYTLRITFRSKLTGVALTIHPPFEVAKLNLYPSTTPAASSRGRRSAVSRSAMRLSSGGPSCRRLWGNCRNQK